LEYPIYGKPGCFISLPISEEIEENDYCEVLRLMGYEKKVIASPYHYNDNDCPCVQIVCFRKIKLGSIVELRDHEGSVLEFYCENDWTEMAAIEKFVSIMKDITSIEYMNQKVYDYNERGSF